jgi:hypothetical protein
VSVRREGLLVEHGVTSLIDLSDLRKHQLKAGQQADDLGSRMVWI